ncbi:MAG: hypothetical protein S4CHLAM81_12830 [Chlamydiales bacterium]|nr:hypothetical protein [Chlamydiales bacterium]MCH9636058.1 hypothetical protein [Chlamydiales bacterium]MCH9703992.1 BtaA family protein [Chlamydiota bacterium]
MEDFYHRLSYSFGNEDWETEKRALKIQKGDHVLCVTASGDRPLNLLTQECGQITSVDTNGMQNALLDLKRVALERLPYDEYLRFLGMKDASDRMQTYSAFSADLDPKSHALWMRHKRAIKRGVIFQGAIERRTKMVTFLVNLTRRRKVKRLFSFDNVQEQRDFVDKSFETKSWRNLIDLLLKPRLTRIFLSDPGLYEYVDSKINAGTYIHDRLHSALGQFPAKQSPLLSMILRGYVDPDHLPPYLTQAGVEQIRPRLDRLKIETADLISFLENSPENSYDCFSLSDVASYVPYEAFERMVKAVQRCAKPGARFSIRQFMTNYEMPSSVANFFERDRELEEKLSKEDRCFVYRFMTGTIKK